MVGDVTINDVSTGRRVTGKLYKVWPHGIIIDDARGVRFFAYFHNVINGYPERITADKVREKDLFQ